MNSNNDQQLRMTAAGLREMLPPTESQAKYEMKMEKEERRKKKKKQENKKRKTKQEKHVEAMAHA